MVHKEEELKEKKELYYDSVGYLLSVPVDDPALLSLALQLPAETTLALEMETIDPDGLHNSRQKIKRELADLFHNDFLHLYNTNKTNDLYQITSEAMGMRSLKNTALSYLMSLDPLPPEILEICVKQYKQAANMTDMIAALGCITNLENTIRSELFNDFYIKWQNESLVIDKWFPLQAISICKNTLNRVKQLIDSSSFSIQSPNKVRSLIGAFCSSNHVRFHDISGEGYSFLGDMIIRLNCINPQIAARLVAPLINWKRYGKSRQILMKEQLDRLAKEKELSRDVAEIVDKSR
jgi:aminopeptidase N